MALTVQQCPEDTTINSVLNPAITLSTIKMKFLVLFAVLATSYAVSHCLRLHIFLLHKIFLKTVEPRICERHEKEL